MKEDTILVPREWLKKLLTGLERHGYYLTEEDKRQSLSALQGYADSAKQLLDL